MLEFIPQPKSVKEGSGYFQVPAKGSIGISGVELDPLAEEIWMLLGDYSVAVALKRVPDTVRLVLKEGLKPGGYTLTINAKGIAIEADSVDAAWCAVQTLGQIVQQCPKGKLREVTIRDWPDFADRGVYYDVCRGRVPTLESLMKQADLLAHYKINQLQYYVKHTFTFRGHPDIGKNCGPLTPDEILELDAYCREIHVELVPSIASFGHMDRILEHPQYHHLAEDWGAGKYIEKDIKPWVKGPWSVSPANPDIYPFIDSLWSEFLPLFSSRRFNMCCDETYDLGWGQSYELCKKKGKGKVYLDHILKLRKLAARHGKKVMFWGDIIHHHPELIPQIPKDVTVLDWGYWYGHNCEQIAAFKQAGCAFMACPGVGSWGRLFPQLTEATQNIANYAKAGLKHGATGLLNTDWGDNGHFNLMEFSWHGYLFGAEQSWNAKADKSTFTRRFCRLFLNIPSAEMARAVDEIGEISTGWWQMAFFAKPGDKVYERDDKVGFLTPEGKLYQHEWNAALGRRTLARLVKVRKVLAQYAKGRAVDPQGVLPYWIFAADTLIHAARKQAAFGRGGKATAALRRSLKRELTELMERFRALWMASNKKSEIEQTLKRYRRAIKGL